MDKLICFCFALLTSLYVYSASAEDSPVLPKSFSLDDSFKQELPALPAYSEPSQSRNNSYMGEVKELQPVSNTYAENESVTISTKFTGNHNDVNIVNASKDNLPPIFIDFEHRSDVGSSPTFNTNNYYPGSSQRTKAFLPLGNKSAESGGETTDATKHGSVSTGKETFFKNKNAVSSVHNQQLLSLYPKYQPEKQLPKHDTNSERQYQQNYSRPELLQKKLNQKDSDFKEETDQHNQLLHTNASQKSSSEWVPEVSNSKLHVPHKKDESSVMNDFYDDNNEDDYDDSSDSDTSEGHDKVDSYSKDNDSVKNGMGKVHTELSVSDKLATDKNKHLSFPWSPVNSKLNKTLANNNYDIEKDDDGSEDKENNDYIINKDSQEFDSSNANSYNKNGTHRSDKKNDDAVGDVFANKYSIEGVKENGSNNQTGRLKEEDETTYETKRDEADVNIDEYDLQDIMGDTDLNNQVKKDDSSNQTRRSSKKGETEMDKAVSKTEKSNAKDMDSVDYNNQLSAYDDSIDEPAVDSTDNHETEEISDVDAVALHTEAVSPTLLSGSHSKNGQGTGRRVVIKNSKKDYRDNEGLKDGNEEYTEDGDDDIVLGEHDNDDDDDDEEYDVAKWSDHGDDDNESDYDDGTEDDFDELKNPQDEVATKKRQPTAPTKMVLFYTWMVVAVLLIIVGISTYQSRCRGFRFFGAKTPNPKDDRKRLMEHEFV